MVKVIAALHADDLRERLFSPSLRSALADAGATALQVNLDDDDVAPAMRFGPAERITALVSVWTDGSPSAAVEVLAEVAGEEPHAYLVSERVRLDPEPVADGVRADAIVQMALLRWSASMTREEYLEYWMVRHTPIAIRTQATTAYIQNLVEEALTPSSPELSAIVEEHFPMEGMADPHAYYGSRGDDAELRRRSAELMESVARFGADQNLDLVPTSRYLWRLP